MANDEAGSPHTAGPTRRTRTVTFLLGVLAWCAVVLPPALARADGPVLHRIAVTGDRPGNGYFDVSVEYGSDGMGWMAYSRVLMPRYVETHIARSTDGGRTWTYVDAPNTWADGVLYDDGKSYTGAWRYETPTLLYDATDRPERRWKLYVQRYLSVPPYKRGHSLFAKGWIETRHAASPAGPWSPPVRLFGKRGQHCRVDLNTLDASLRDVVFYSEPGSVVVGGTIYLSMDASTTASGLGEWPKRRIVLIASDDHGATWRYVGTLTDYRDARQLGYRVLTASSLVRVGGHVFLLVSPSGATGLFRRNRGHDGTVVVEFADIAHARLARDRRGHLVVSQWIRPTAKEGGESDYDEHNVNGGIIFSQIDLKAAPQVFGIYDTRMTIPAR